MKRFLQTLILTFGLATVLITTPHVITGCTTSQQRITYNTLATVGQTVNTTYSAYLDLVVKGTVPSTSVPQVSKVYNDFQAAYALAISAAQFNPQAIAPQNVVDLANNLVALINQLKGK